MQSYCVCAAAPNSPECQVINFLGFHLTKKTETCLFVFRLIRPLISDVLTVCQTRKTEKKHNERESDIMTVTTKRDIIQQWTRAGREFA